MKKENKKQNIEVGVLADKTVLGSGKANDRVLEITVTAPKKETNTERPPLNLSLVIDRSGSMQGEKLDYARRAAAHVVNLLDLKDSAAVVTYDDTIQTLVPAQLMTAENKAKTIEKIHSVRAGGSTNLGGGWLRGCEEVAGNSKDNSFNRTLLLTDGLANVGMTSIEELSMHARQLFRREVSTSCFGVGMGYDEHLLEAMANNGGGNFHFLETINAIPLVFEREFLELIDIVVKDIEITLNLPETIKAEICGNWQSEINGDGHLRIFLNSMISDHKQSLFVKLHLSKNTNQEEISIPILISGKSESNVPLMVEQSITLNKVSKKEEAAIEQNKGLMERFAVVDLADKAKEALKRERIGDRAGAASLIHDSMKTNQRYITPNMSSKYNNFSAELRVGLDEKSRKRFHQNEYESGRGRSSVRDYRIRLIKGYMIADIEGLSVLIDTGSKVTFGKQDEWLFLNRVHNLKQNSSGITLEQLSQFVGQSLDIVLGMDIMKHYFVTIDLQNSRITISQRPVRQTNSHISLTLEGGIPGCQGEVNGKIMDLFINTGSKLTYVNNALARTLTSVGVEKVFYPIIGEFKTELYKIPALIGGLDIKLKCGVPPFKDEKKMFPSGHPVVLGNQVFSNTRVCLAFPEKQMMFLR